MAKMAFLAATQKTALQVNKTRSNFANHYLLVVHCDSKDSNLHQVRYVYSSQSACTSMSTHKLRKLTDIARGSLLSEKRVSELTSFNVPAVSVSFETMPLQGSEEVNRHHFGDQNYAYSSREQSLTKFCSHDQNLVMRTELEDPAGNRALTLS